MKENLESAAVDLTNPGIPDAPFAREDRAAELRQKRCVLQEFLAEQKLDALLITRHENIAWATAGLAEVRLALTREVGAAALLITRQGPAYYLTTANEAPRLAEEEFAELDLHPAVQPWYASDTPAAAREIVGAGSIACDDCGAGFSAVSMKPLRLRLTEGEVARYRWLGRAVGEVAAETARQLTPGMTEAAMQAMIAERLLARRILPSVLLTAVDERIRRFRHAVPRGGVLERFGMLNFCARRWGLCISITRFVHFGPMPRELERSFDAAAQVNARLLHASRAGATGDDLFGVAQAAYAEQGFAGEEQMHHQGGATGYWEREWIARPGGTEQVLNSQAMAWNPSVQGAKVEDTVIVHGDRIEVLTRTPDLPEVETRYEGSTFHSAGVLIVQG